MMLGFQFLHFHFQLLFSPFKPWLFQSHLGFNFDMEFLHPFFNVICELHSQLSLCLTGVALLICLILFGECLWHSPHQIGQQFASHRPRWRTKCNGWSPIKVYTSQFVSAEKFTPSSSFQRNQICPDFVFLQLNFVRCVIHYTVDYCCIFYCSISPDN